MNFKKKTGAAVLAIAAASILAVPGVALASTYDTGGAYTAEPAFTQTAATSVTVTADESAIDLDAGTNLSSITVDFGSTATPTMLTLPKNYTGTLAIMGDHISGLTVKADMSDMNSMADDAMVITLASDADHYLAISNGKNITDASHMTMANVFYPATTATDDEINDFLNMAPYLTEVHIAGNTTGIDTLDFSNNTMLETLYIADGSVSVIDGLDMIVGTDVDIMASDLNVLAFGENDSIVNLRVQSDLMSLDVTGLTAMTHLDVSNCSDLAVLDLTDTDMLANLNITGTKLAALNAGDSSSSLVITPAATSGMITIDTQYASVTENSDDDDYNDYVFDLDGITNDMGEYINTSSSNFSVVTSDGTTVAGNATSGGDLMSGDWFDYSSGVLTITSMKVPQSISYIMDANNTAVGANYKVLFMAKSQGNRIAGVDRYDTMRMINTDKGDMDFDEVYPGATDVVVASGADYADALSASALAGAMDTGIVTTDPADMGSETIDMLDDMAGQGTAYIVGGTSAVSYGVEQQLTDLGFQIKRYGGADRFDTAIKVQDGIKDMIAADTGRVTTVTNDTVIIASGAKYPDALAISPYAYTQNMPIVLVGSDGMMDSATAALFNKYKEDYSNAIIVGGTAVVSDDVTTMLEGYDMDVIRLAGADRYETNLVLNEWLDSGSSNISTSNAVFMAAGYSSDDITDMNDTGIKAAAAAMGNSYDATAYVATGKGFADALAVAPLAGMEHGTINLVSDTDTSTVAMAKDEGASTIIIGGTAVISNDLADVIDGL